MQIVQDYLQPFRRNSLLTCVLQPEIAKNSPKTSILGVQGHSMSSMLTPLRSLSLLSATVFMLEKAISVPLFRGVPLFDAGVRRPL